MNRTTLSRLRRRVEGFRCRECGRLFEDAGPASWRSTIVHEVVIGSNGPPLADPPDTADWSHVTPAERLEIDSVYSAMLVRVAGLPLEACRGCEKPHHSYPELIAATDDELRRLDEILERIAVRNAIPSRCADNRTSRERRRSLG